MPLVADKPLKKKNKKRSEPYSFIRTEVWNFSEQNAWKLPEKITVSDWCDQNIVLDERVSAEPGPWRTSRTPYLREILDAFADKSVEEISFKASTQVGKTACMLNMECYAIDQDPGPLMHVGPTKDLVKEFNVERIQPMIQLSPALMKHTTGKRDDLQKYFNRLDRMSMYLGWAQSAASLASKPVKYLFFDETNKYPAFAGREADPIKLGRERTRTFVNRRKIVKVSTPTREEGYISQEYEKSDKRKYFVSCPHCSTYQIFNFRNGVKWPENVTSEEIQLDSLAWYECECCKQKIVDADKQEMLEGGVWCPEGCHVNKDGDIVGKIPMSSHRGYWLNAIYSPWLTFSDIAKEFLDSKDDKATLMNFVNSWLAEDWKEKSQERKPDKIRKLICDYPRSHVPEGAILLTAGIDTQKDHFAYVIRAWGVSYQSWLVEAGYCDTWNDIVNNILQKRFPSLIDGVEDFPVRLSCMDSGGTKNENGISRTSEVYEFCRLHKGVVLPVKGQERLTGRYYKSSNLDSYPDGRSIPGGLKLYHLDTNYFKDNLDYLMRPEHEKFRLHAGVEDDYIKQMCSEAKMPKKNSRSTAGVVETWQPISKKAANHLWDCEVYARLAAEMLYVHQLTEKHLPKPVFIRKEKKVFKKSVNNFIGDTGGWL